jgi:hypothetical protein
MIDLALCVAGCLLHRVGTEEMRTSMPTYRVRVTGYPRDLLVDACSAVDSRLHAAVYLLCNGWPDAVSESMSVEPWYCRIDEGEYVPSPVIERVLPTLRRLMKQELA